MARPKKQTRQTSFVTIRQKERAKGRKSLYLDIYKDGKRSYEFLDLYLVPEIDEAAKVLNENTMSKAMAIRNQRELIVINGGTLQKEAAKKILLADWMEKMREEKKKTGQSGSRADTINSAMKHLMEFAGDTVTLADVDKDFCKGFIQYLINTDNRRYTKNSAKLSKSAARTYYEVLMSALNEAERQEIISTNPGHHLNQSATKPIRNVKSTRSYLTIEDVRKLIATDFNHEQTKRAFLFSCFTGLRLSDIENLTWANVSESNGSTYLSIIIQKTREPFTIKLNNEALKWMPEHGKESKVFSLPHRANINKQVKTWAEKAGIDKYVCFHTARHTFATMTLTLGADLYTVSKLLAHQNISVTQVYAEIINEKKDKAVDLANGLFD